MSKQNLESNILNAPLCIQTHFKSKTKSQNQNQYLFPKEKRNLPLKQKQNEKPKSESILNLDEVDELAKMAVAKKLIIKKNT